ncbi:vanin-like protein 1 isoform X1 [Nilaparvata lugens]|uniref:vanin-like protein 1 isoform X1 n=1 Tax=Nilaparvata lugens TaxID=108931 RepID=UPI00193D0139|nr:vanin-like protein 1 isoform X1 [Nilaparvata lugens]
MLFYNNLIIVVIAVSSFLSFISLSHTFRPTVLDQFNNLTIGDDNFLAAVIEYGGQYNGTGQEQVLYNLEQYVQIVYYVTTKVPNISIIVFPEVGLQRIHGPSSDDLYAEPVPDGDENVTPCSSNDTVVLNTLSCLAKGYNTYLVANLIESHTPENTSTVDYYNTNVVFNRNGTLIARYRKFNIYGIDGKPLRKPTTPDLTHFDTDFGVRFGTFICFDIAFQTPALDLILKHNITHFAYPVAWVSELPFLTALQMQAGWAQANNVVLMAAGLNNPLNGSTGSGIYAGSKLIGAYQTTNNNNFAVVGIVPKNLTNYQAGNITSVKLSLAITQPETEVLGLLEDRIDTYRGELLAENKKYRKGEGIVGLAGRWSRTELKDRKVCYGDFCCKFSLNFTVFYLDSILPLDEVVDTSDHFGSNEYMIVAFDGVRSYGGGLATGGIKVCALVSCLNRNSSSCALPTVNATQKSVVFNSVRRFFKTDTVFHNIFVETEIAENENNIFVMPDAISRHTSSPSRGTGIEFGKIETDYSFERSLDTNKNITHVKMVNTAEMSNLGAFGVYARVFSRDGMNATTNISYIDYYDTTDGDDDTSTGSKGIRLTIELITLISCSISILSSIT